MSKLHAPSCRRLTTIIVLLSSLILATPAPVIRQADLPDRSIIELSRVQPALLTIAAEQPDAMVSVIIQKTTKDAGVEEWVTRLGGAITQDLHIINAFVARLPAKAARELARADGVRWISLNARTQQMSDRAVFTAWATELGQSSPETNPLAADFNSTPIAASRALWFSSVIKPSGLGAAPTTVRVFDSVIRFTANGAQYEIPAPDGRVLYSPTATSASTTFDPETGAWLTTAPSSYTSEAFISGVIWPVAAALPGDIKNVTWSGRFAVDTPGVSVDWRWGAAAYSSFISDYSALGVKPISGDKLNPYANSDRAGAPQNLKPQLVKGARGDGGSNYTGAWCPSVRAIYSFTNSNAMISALGPDGVFAYGSEVKQGLAGFEPEVTPGHAIVKVEAVLRVYAPERLSHDFKLKLVVGGASKDVSLKHELFDPYLGEANAGLLAVDLTNLRAWKWGDLSDGLELIVDQYPLSAGEMLYYDAIGLRVTSAPGYDPTGLMPNDVSWPDLDIDPSRQINIYNSVIGADRLWNGANKLQGQGVTVAVVDSGVYKTGDLSKSRLFSVNFSQGYHDSQDRYGHGTFVAGIIAGNGSKSKGRHLGVAPKARLLNIRVSDDQGMSAESDVVAGLQWIYENKVKYNIRVVNLSLNASVAQSYATSPLCAAVEMLWLKGIVVVVSAGNNGSGTLYPPANDPFVITVGATDDRGTISLVDDVMAQFSAYGVTPEGVAKPELVAPGRNIIAFLPGNQDTTIGEEHGSNRIDQNYFRMSGTSMSAPMVAGATALLLQDEPNLAPNQVKYRLMATANKNWPGYNPRQAGAGYLDIYAAVHGMTTGRANAGAPVSKLLWDNLVFTAWNSVSWDSVSWDSVSWGSVSWDSVSWDSVSWDSVSWDSVSWDSVSWDSDYWGP